MCIGIVLMPVRIRIRKWIGTKMEILIRIGIKTMPIHNTVRWKGETASNPEI